MILDPLFILAHEEADGGGGDAQGRDLVSLDDLPQPVGVGIIGGPLKNDKGPPMGHHANDLPGPHHPADVRNPEKDVRFFDVKIVSQLLHHLSQTPRMSMHGPFGTARSP